MTVHTCFREQSRTFFGMIALLLLTMVILTATVGSVGLTGALSINVIERRREIGVLRAIGTTRPAILGTTLDFSYSVSGVIIWLMIVLVLSAVASLWPAWGASRISVREALAYE